MKRMVCLGTLALAAVFTMATTYEARQPHATLVVHEVADNLLVARSIVGPGPKQLHISGRRCIPRLAALGRSSQGSNTARMLPPRALQWPSAA